MILSDLARQMTHHHVASVADPVPERRGISYIWAGNGVFKYGRNADTEVIVRWEDGSTPGLPDLDAAIAWDEWPGRLPGALLAQVLAEARLAEAPKGGEGSDAAALVPVEAQWLVVLDDNHQPRLMRPTQTASPAQVRYELEGMPFLLDLHSHNTMGAFFSQVDDRDDTWLSASVVIGDIFGTPTMLCRLNVYGARQTVPALLLFDDLGPFSDLSMAPETDADPPLPPGDPRDPWTSVRMMVGWLIEALVDAGLYPLTNPADRAQLDAQLNAALAAETKGIDHAPPAA
ncbi:hypothetical protein EKD04_017370 [Chloroflexales bacterium ZM16-3]|nr:hypothetical protein [Chloroflexales bacterium ZM16-3]